MIVQLSNYSLGSVVRTLVVNLSKCQRSNEYHLPFDKCWRQCVYLWFSLRLLLCCLSKSKGCDDISNLKLFAGQCCVVSSFSLNLMLSCPSQHSTEMMLNSPIIHNLIFYCLWFSFRLLLCSPSKSYTCNDISTPKFVLSQYCVVLSISL